MSSDKNVDGSVNILQDDIQLQYQSSPYFEGISDTDGKHDKSVRRSVIGKLVTNFVEADTEEEEEEEDIWSRNNDNLVSDYLSHTHMFDEDLNIPHVDFSKSVIRLDKRHNVMKHMVMSMDRRDVQWIKENFNCRVCVQFVYNPDTGLCYCGRQQLDHDKSLAKQDDQGSKSGNGSGVFSTDVVWDAKKDTELVPTNALGRVLFSDDDHFASRYIRVAEDTAQDRIFRLFKEKWKVNTPGMVISTIGSLEGLTITKELKVLIKHGIVKAVSKTTGWILTEGVDTGIVKVMGDACHQYGYPFPCIGITNWGNLRDSDVLVTNPAQSMFERVKDMLYDEAVHSELNRLETHHTHFVLVDDGTVKGKNNSEVKFKAKFEQYISDTLRTPIVVVLLQGGLVTLRNVLTYLKRAIPIISIPDSGGMANLLKYFLDHLTKKQGEIRIRGSVVGDMEESCTCRCGKDPSLVLTCPEVQHRTKAMFPEYSEVDVEECLHLFVKVVEYRTGVTFYDKNDPFEAVILKSLLQKDTYSLRSQLELALRWDRLDVAADILEKRDITLPESQYALSLTLFNAIGNDRTDFVEFLLNGGGDINESHGNIEKIFNVNPPPHFVRLLEKHSEYDVGEDQQISLCNLNQLLNYIFGNWYRASTGYENDPYYEFMILNCVLLRKEMAMIMWSRVEEPVKAAIAACLLLRGMKHCSGYAIGADEKLALAEMYQTFESAAVGTINMAYKEDPRVCIIDFTVKWERFKNVTLLNLAWGAHSKKFLATRPAQEIIRHSWRGGIRRSVPLWKSIAVAIFPFLLVFSRLIPFRTSVIYNTNSENATAKRKEKRKPIDGLIKRITTFYNSPVIKFQNHALWYLFFLIHHTIVLLKFLGSEYEDLRELKPIEGILIAIVVFYFIEEIRQFAVSGKGFRSGYLENVWNKLDITMYSLYLIGILLWLFAFGNPLLSKTYARRCFSWSRALLSVDTLLLFTRILYLSYVDPNMGTLLLILREMSRDFVNILFLMLIILLGYGIALVSLLVKPEEFVAGNLFAVFFYPYFQLFGELNLSHMFNYTTIVNDTSHARLVLANTEAGSEVPLYLSNVVTGSPDILKIVLAIMVMGYMLVVGLGFINLLIAMFSDTYRRIKDNQLDVWKYMRYALLEEYENAPPFFTPILYLMSLLKLIYNFCYYDKTHMLNPDSLKLKIELEEKANAERILRWKKNVLKSLMKESSIAYYEQYLGGNPHTDETYSRQMVDAMQDVNDKIAQLDLQTRLFKHKHFSKDNTQIRFKNKRKSVVPEAATSSNGKTARRYLSKYMSFKRAKRWGEDEDVCLDFNDREATNKKPNSIEHLV